MAAAGGNRKQRALHVRRASKKSGAPEPRGKTVRSARAHARDKPLIAFLRRARRCASPKGEHCDRPSDPGINFPVIMSCREVYICIRQLSLWKKLNNGQGNTKLQCRGRDAPVCCLSFRGSVGRAPSETPLSTATPLQRFVYKQCPLKSSPLSPVLTAI